MGHQQPYNSLSGYYDDWLVNLVIMSLIIIGGVGFIVWDDLSKHKLQMRKYLLQTKIVLIVTAALVFGGGLAFYFLEKDNLMADMSFSGKVLTSLFSSVTARTAGFNTIDTGEAPDLRQAASKPPPLQCFFSMCMPASRGLTALILWGGGWRTT